MAFPDLASTSVSLRGIFWLYASKDGSGASLADLLDLAVLLPIEYVTYSCNIKVNLTITLKLFFFLRFSGKLTDISNFFSRPLGNILMEMNL